MSLEQTVEKLTAAIEGYTKVLQAAISTAGGQVAAAAPTTTTAGKTTKPAAKAAEPEAAPVSKPATGKKAKVGLEYETVKARTLEVLAEKGRDVVSAVLQNFGDFASAKELDPSQYAEYMVMLDQVMTADDDSAADDEEELA